MLRVTVIEILLISLPFLVFFAYRMMMTRAGKTNSPTDERVYQMLFLAGVGLVIVGLVFAIWIRDQDGGNNDRIYVPPRTENGRVIAGEFITREEAVRRGILQSVDDTPPPDPETRVRTSEDDAAPGDDEPT